jgi:hypothetical protein
MLFYLCVPLFVFFLLFTATDPSPVILCSCERHSVLPPTIKAEIKDKFPDASALVSPQLPLKRELGVKLELSLLVTAKEQMLGQRTPPRPLKMGLGIGRLKTVLDYMLGSQLLSKHSGFLIVQYTVSLPSLCFQRFYLQYRIYMVKEFLIDSGYF